MESNCNMNCQNDRYSGCDTRQSRGQQNLRNQNFNRNMRGDCDTRSNYNSHSRTVQDRMGRSMQVDCVCTTNTSGGCSMRDPMARLGDDFPIAMAYVPWQDWGEVYDSKQGLCRGTIFKELDKIFCGVRC